MIEKEVLYKLIVEEGKTQYEIAEMLGVTQGNVSYFARKYKLKKNRKTRRDYKPKRTNKTWTDKEKDMLSKYYGTVSFEDIATRLGRTPKGIRSQKEKMQLGEAVGATEYINISDLAEALGRNKRVVRSWFLNKGLPATYKTITIKKKVYRIDVKKFWKWCKDNPKLMKWEKYQRNSLGNEPKWLDKVIKDYYKNYNENIDKKWGKIEKSYLLAWYYKKVPIKEIARRLKRTEGAVQAKLSGLKVKRKKILLDWQPIEIEMLLKMRKKGLTMKKIADELGRTENSVTQKYFKIKKEKISI